MISETKIEATHRLQKDGRWHQASRFRERHREAMKAEGVRRKEAREKSWQLTIARFQPIDQDWFDWHMRLARFPSLSIPRDLRWKFCWLWSAACQLSAFLGSQDEHLRPEALKDATVARLTCEPDGVEPTGTADQPTLDVLLATREPQELLEDIGSQLSDVALQVDLTKPGGPETVAEINLMIELLLEMRQAAEDFWPEVNVRQPC